jgi:hypothetical protein
VTLPTPILNIERLRIRPPYTRLMTSEPVVEITDGIALLDAIPRAGGRTIGWGEFGAPVVDRGVHAIFPLAVARVQDVRDPAASTRLQERERALELACIHFYGGDGFHAEMHLDTDAGYGWRLIETAMLVRTPRYWWGIGQFAAVLVHSVEQRSAFETLALHIIPKEWVWYSPLNSGTKREASRQRRIAREQETVAGAADVVWSWPLGKDVRA